MPDETTIRRYWWAAGLMGLCAPGLGQLYNGRERIAGYIVGAFVALFALFHTSIPSTFLGFAAVFGGAILVAWGGAVEAGIHAWRHSNVARRSFHRWYVYVAYAVVFTLVGTGINMGALAALGQPSMFGAYRPYRLPSGSGEPNLMPGDYFLAATVHGATKRKLSGWLGSIVVVSWPGEEGVFVFRLIAVEGQTVAVTDQKVLVDGKALPKRTICSVGDPASGEIVRRSVETVGRRSYVVQNFPAEFARATDEVSVPEGHSFVMGDNRENANDIRFLRGPAPNTMFAGRALFIFWSDDWSRIGRSLVPGASVDELVYCPAGGK